ncbi:MAG: methionyl-tRNA formyltransferase [Alphaproteobacteria bacterium]|nr:methionyl-tRNA formyltransferase [Alphaproteobacteria bacterium]MDD9919977.1 methionyl-tRNA formyltransferase [Alphaproteobacteria bacterium]
MRLIFMGSPDFAVPSLEALLASQHEVVCVYTQPPRPAGRGHKIQKTAVHQLAEKHNLAIHTPQHLKGEALEELLSTPCDAIVVVAYGILLPQAVIDHAPCVNVHFSALPRWRGAAPVQHAIFAGDVTTEICIAKLELKLDSGPVYLRKSFPLPENITTGEGYTWFSQEAATPLVQVMDDFENLTPIPQSENGITIAPKVTSDMRPIDWRKPAHEVHNHIRGMSPWPGATTVCGDEIWKILRSEKADRHGAAGEVLDITETGITVACGAGAVRLLVLQRPSKKAMDVADFVKGINLSVGNCFNSHGDL